MFKRINPVSVTNVILFLCLSKYLYTIIVVILIIVSRVFSRLAEREEKAWSVSLLSPRTITGQTVSQSHLLTG